MHSIGFTGHGRGVLGALACLVLACRASGDVIVAEHDWDTTPLGTNVAPWWTQDSASSLAVVSNAPHNSNWLKITPTAPDAWQDTIGVDANDLYVGTWSTNMWVSFDFWSAGAAPDEIEVRWQGAKTTNIWGFSLPVVPAQGRQWTSFEASFAYADGKWEGSLGGDGEDYLADLDSIDWIGVYIFRDDDESDVYGLDDSKLTVPEPEEYAMLLACLATALMLYRRRHIAETVGVGAIDG